jgi:replication initiation and membrane attachment protein DnaB
MPMRANRVSPALKHGAYSQSTLLPGEDPAEFEELHRGLVEEFRPNGRMEEETVASIAHLMWRRQNLAQFEIGQLSNLIVEALKKAPELTKKETDELFSDMEKLAEAKRRAHKAEGDRKNEAQVELLEISKTVTLNRLMKELDVEERLDAMIDRLIKRLLFVRGVKSMTNMSSAGTAPPATAQKNLRRIRAV